MEVVTSSPASDNGSSTPDDRGTAMVTVSEENSQSSITHDLMVMELEDADNVIKIENGAPAGGAMPTEVSCGDAFMDFVAQTQTSHQEVDDDQYSPVGYLVNPHSQDEYEVYGHHLHTQPTSDNFAFQEVAYYGGDDGVEVHAQQELQALKQVIEEKKVEILNLTKRLQECSKAPIVNGFTSLDGATQDDNDPDYLGESADKVNRLFSQVIKVYWEKYAKVRNELLNLDCRLVCKSWKEGMDKLLGIQDPISLKNGNVRQLETTLKNLVRDYEVILPPSTVDIVDVCSELHIWNLGTSLNSRAKIVDILEKFGTNVEYFSHRVEKDQYGSLGDWYETVRNWLLLLPNLKCLAIIYPNSETEFGDVLLEPAVRDHPFPKLENLTTIAEGMIPNSVSHSALMTNSQITELTTTLSCNFNGILLPNLKILTVYVSFKQDSHFLSLTFLNSPLESLKIIFCDFIKVCHVTRAFGVVQHFRDTLTTLHLNLPVYSREFSPFPVIIPKLLKLTLDLQGESRSMLNGDKMPWNEGRLGEFLSCCDILEHLTILNFCVDKLGWFSIKDSGNCKSVVRVELRIKLVNVLWERLPSLKTVEITLASEMRPDLVGPFLFIRQTCSNAF